MDDKSEEDFQKVSEYLIAACEFMKPVPMEKYFDVGRCPQTIVCTYIFKIHNIYDYVFQLRALQFHRNFSG